MKGVRLRDLPPEQRKRARELKRQATEQGREQTRGRCFGG